jgi:hypothetical protein
VVRIEPHGSKSQRGDGWIAAFVNKLLATTTKQKGRLPLLITENKASSRKSIVFGIENQHAVLAECNNDDCTSKGKRSGLRAA